MMETDIPQKLQSCDTFVVLPPKSKNGKVIFGKNSDRPSEEVQEIIYKPKTTFPNGSKLKCTYIEIDQVEHTHAVILSKPSWMWGAEMGSNECGVCIGNEAVWTKLNSDKDLEEKLLGMDLLRLGLERGSTAKNALEVIIDLLEKYGQGGPCSDSNTTFSYHNSFLITDPTEAWVLETAGHLWAAQRIQSGFYNISNALTIETKIDMMAEGLIDHAITEGYWDNTGEFNFSNAYGVSSSSASQRRKCGQQLLEKFSDSAQFEEVDMFAVLRDEQSGICMSGGYFCSTSSQVSVLSPPASNQPSVHWFTGTPDPAQSVFKPFIFCDVNHISPHCQSPIILDEEDPAKMKPRFQSKVNRAHLLYKYHQKAVENGAASLETLRQLETKCVSEIQAFLDAFTPSQLNEVEDLFKDVVESEIKFYK